jgi:hypothetical protein
VGTENQSDAQEDAPRRGDDAALRAENGSSEPEDLTDEAITQAREARAASIREAISRDDIDLFSKRIRQNREALWPEKIAKDIDHLNRLLPVLSKLRKIKSVDILEGPARHEGQPPKTPPAGAAIVYVDKHFFFEKPLDLDDDDELSLREFATNYRSFGTYEGEKLCGGFHPDANIRIITDQGVVQMLACFGCSQIRVIDDTTDMMMELEEEAHRTLATLCDRRFRHRTPDAVADEEKAEPGVGADSR